MRSLGQATGAITLANALFTGVGAALAVDLPLEVLLEMDPPAGSHPTTGPAPTGGFASAALADALNGFGGAGRTGRVEVRSAIPPRRGLKSSSALGVAIVRATASALGCPVSDEESARRAARFAREYGESATGAFDDALAAAEGGIVVTDNRTEAVLKRARPPDGCVAVIDLGLLDHRPPAEYREAFVRHADEAQTAIQAALRGDWGTAIEQNSAAVESALGVDLAERRAAARALGALGSGLSGMGPAFASLIDRDRLASFVRALPPSESDRLVVDLVEPRPVGAGGA